MPKLFRNPVHFEKLPRIVQITNAHCGPAVVVMLLSHLGIKVEQDEIVDAAGSSHKRLNRYGMSVPEMAVAIDKLFPNIQFWMKDNTTIPELRSLVVEHKYPVGVEWQGEFLEYGDDDNGHYSVITHIDDWDNMVYIADPYPRFAGRDRRIPLSRFEELWWDINDVRDTKTDRMIHVKDYHMVFIITPKNETFPRELKMVRG